MKIPFLQNRIILADGAFGTYYSELTGDSVNRVELANIANPNQIVSIHREYIEAGSRFIRTNTFSANTVTLGIDLDKLKELIVESVLLARKAIGKREVYIAANIGPIPQVNNDGELINEIDILNEYFTIIKTFYENGCSIFNFETFSSTHFIKEIVEYIKKLNETNVIIFNFSIDKHGFTRNSFNISEIIDECRRYKIDIIGINCGSGPTHLVKYLDGVDSLFPNAGYPELVDNRTVFNSSPKYFANVIKPYLNKLRIVGGCCGTTPENIRELAKFIYSDKNDASKPLTNINNDQPKVFNKIEKNNFIIAVELDPPSIPNLTGTIESAKKLVKLGVDLITVADSPSGRMRLNSITTALKIERESGARVMPHICCRDRNLIALKSDILAAYAEGIRDLLIVTGDPIPQEERDEVKKVFNCNSVTLMNQIDNLNKTLLVDDPIVYGGALNLSSMNLDVQRAKMVKKIEAGASIFLTQPIYEERSIEYLKNINRDFNIKILAGILPIVTYKNAQFLNNEFPGITIPENIISRFSPEMSRDEAEDVGVNIAVETVNKLSSYVEGFYFITPFNRISMIEKILKNGF